jgi:hypothetical protein
MCGNTRGILFSVLHYHLMGLSYHFFVNCCYINIYNISLYFFACVLLRSCYCQPAYYIWCICYQLSTVRDMKLILNELWCIYRPQYY